MEVEKEIIEGNLPLNEEESNKSKTEEKNEAELNHSISTYKSGKGNAGFDVRACLVDEDYAGFVHLSMAYTKDLYEDGKNIVYVGDKLVQMMLIPIFHTQYEEVSKEEYEDIMSQSNRGESGFGSSDIKH